nr:hypothetical protein [Tanacetum cinerariifolium]
MANLSHYGSDALAEVHNPDNMDNNMINQGVQVMPSSKQSNILNHSETKITSDSSIIPYSRYVTEFQQAVVQNSNSFTQQEQLKTQVTNCTKINLENKSVNDTLTIEKAQQLKPKLYDGNVIKNTYAIVIPDSEETLMLAEKSHSKMLLKQQDLMVLEKKVNTRPVDYANSMNSSDLSPSCTPTRVKDNSISNQSAPNFDQYFELNEMKAQSQEKDMVITKLNERIKSFSGNINKDKVKKDIDKIEMINIEHVFDQENSEQGLIIAALKDDLKNLKGKL